VGMSQVETVVAPNPRSGRPRRILSGLALVLACFSILVSTVAVWTHQVALNTNRFTALIDDVTSDPAVTDPISLRISTQVVDALGVQARLEARLPDALKPLAGTLTIAVQDAIDQRLRVALQNPRVHDALVGSLSFTHAQVVRLLRGESEVVSLVDGYLTLNVFPLVGTALTELQAMGLIPADVQLPDLTAPDAPEALAQRLETTLGITLPPDFGTIQVMPAERLAVARTVVTAFDLVVILLVALTLILVAIALWLARDRRRMLIYLGVGTIIAFLISRLAIRSVEDAIVGGIADGDVAGAVRALLDATLEDLRGLTLIILVATAIIAIAAYVWGRPTWIVKTASSVGGVAGSAGSAASGAVAAGADRAPDRETLEATVRENRTMIERIGLGAIVFALVWLALSLEIALLGAALFIGFEIVLRALSDEPESTSVEDESPSDGQPAGGG
jgi:uncharacterized membrane protein